MLSELLKAISAITNPYSLTAFGIAAVVIIFLRMRKKIPVWVAVLIPLVVIVIVSIISYKDILLRREDSSNVRRVRITVIDSSQTPLSDTEVILSVGGEKKKVSEAWEFEIPESNIPSDRRVIIYASKTDNSLSTRKEIVLPEGKILSFEVSLGKAQEASTKPHKNQELASYIEQARMFYERAQYQDACNILDKALSLEPGNQEAIKLKNQIERTKDILNRSR
jgi:hypothetical protein